MVHVDEISVGGVGQEIRAVASRSNDRQLGRQLGGGVAEDGLSGRRGGSSKQSRQANGSRPASGSTMGRGKGRHSDKG